MNTVKLNSTLDSIAAKLEYQFNTDDLVQKTNDVDKDLINIALVNRLLGSSIKSYGEKLYNRSTKTLEAMLPEDVPPGQKKCIYSHDGINLIKEVRKPQKNVDTEKFCDLLRQAGVSVEIIEKALLDSTNERKPAVYLKIDKP